MENYYLSESDYLKMLSFIKQTKKYYNNFQQHILNLLHDIFGYQYATFNLIDQNLDLYNPRMWKITENARDQYYDHYHKTDIFHPKNTANLWMNKKVISITDIMPISQYENTEYYLDFLKQDMLYYQLVVPLVVNNRLIGGIGLFKEKDQGDFINRDFAILNRLNEFISSDLWAFLEYASIREGWQTYNNCFDETPTGIIILDKNFSITYCNQTAEEYSRSLKISMRQFVFMVTSMFFDEINNPDLDIKFSYKSYKINIKSKPTYSLCDGMNPVYMIFIEENRKESEDIGVQLENYGLTARESEILELVRNGLSNGEIAENLFISIHTVKSHMENIFTKLQVKNRTAALYKISRPDEKN